MGEIKIERLEGKGVQAKIIKGGKQYDTYFDFAIAAGYPSAAGVDVVAAEHYEGKVVNVLAKGNHEHGWDTIYVCETAYGDQFLIGKQGIELVEPTSIPTLVSATIDQLMAELKARVEQAVTTVEPDEEDTLIAEFMPESSPLRTRTNVVERAQWDVEGIDKRGSDAHAINGGEGNNAYRENFYNVEFVVDSKKRTVVALVRLGNRNRGQSVAHRGIAKCDPEDCFNEYIGKAIAVRRAFELPVPSEYLNAPAPEGKQAGDIISSELGNLKIVMEGIFVGKTCHVNSIYANEGTVIDDTARY